MVSPTTTGILSPIAACILWISGPTTAQPRPPPLASLLAVHPLLHTTSNTPVGSALSRSSSVSFQSARLCSLCILVHFVPALPFEVSTAFILGPSLAINHLSSWLQPSPSTPIGPAPPVPPPRLFLHRPLGLFLAFVFVSSALAPPLEGRVQAHTTPPLARCSHYLFVISSTPPAHGSPLAIRGLCLPVPAPTQPRDLLLFWPLRSLPAAPIACSHSISPAAHMPVPLTLPN